MSFDLLFQPCRFDGSTEKRINPFTKQLQELPRNAPLSAAEVDAVARVLTGAGATQADEFGCRVVSFADGGSAEVFTKDLHEGCMFAIRGAGVTHSLAQLLFDVMVAGNWVLMADEAAIAPTNDCVKSPPTDFGKVVVAASAAELAAFLAGGFEQWKAYRDRILQ